MKLSNNCKIRISYGTKTICGYSARALSMPGGGSMCRVGLFLILILLFSYGADDVTWIV